MKKKEPLLSICTENTSTLPESRTDTSQHGFFIEDIAVKLSQ